ncbi:MAG: cytosine permease [Bacteroidetes bacterium]|nr:cytosine permease [Bacteroidota bacterium]MBU1113499.1 cytosine permease [Bacteroidota bacterium]MBU1797390.1 cytosine permease [Bacteroidota bacterium]
MNKEKSLVEDFPLEEVPKENRKSFWSLTSVLLGFTFFTATMWAGGTLGTAFKLFPDLLLIIGLGNLLLGAYVAALGYISFKSGLNTVMMGRFSFGEFGSKIVDLVLGITQIGWYAWGTATISIILTEFLQIDKSYSSYLMIFFGFAFCWTAIIGYKGLEKLSIIAVPMMIILIFISIYISINDVGGFSRLLDVIPTTELTFSAAITLVFGTFASGGTQATNWVRFASSGKSAIFSSLIAFFVGNGFMILIGTVGALVYQEADIVNVIKIQGLLSLGIIMLFLNIWTTQDNTVYNFSVAGCNFVRTEKRKLVTFIGAAFGTLLAILGMYQWLVPFIILLGTFIPPIGGIIMADFFVKHKFNYPLLKNANLSQFNWVGIISYILASSAAYFSPFVPPIVGIIFGFWFYIFFDWLKVKIKK